jgi:hypothetical protein
VGDPTLDQGKALGVGLAGTKRRHLHQRIARAHAQREHAGLGVAGRDQRAGLRLSARAVTTRRADHRGQHTLGASGTRCHALCQHQPHWCRRTVVVVAVAAVAVQIAECRALGRRRGRNARRADQHCRRQVAQQAARDQARQVEVGRRGRYSMRGERVAIG